MNELELVLSLDKNDKISDYLGDVTIEDFKKHISEIKSKYTDKNAIKIAIENLQKLINE